MNIKPAHDLELFESKIIDNLNLDKNCLYFLNIDREITYLEFVYPLNLIGHIIPINKNYISAKCALNQKYEITNDFKKYKSQIGLYWLMEKDLPGINSLITFPIISSEKTISIFHVVNRKESRLFNIEDVEKLSSIVQETIYSNVAESA